MSQSSSPFIPARPDDLRGMPPREFLRATFLSSYREPTRSQPLDQPQAVLRLVRQAECGRDGDAAPADRADLPVAHRRADGPRRGGW